MIIIGATVFEKKLPLKDPFETASSGKVTAIEEVYVKLETDQGYTGYGEVRGNCTYFTGDSTEAVEATLKNVLLPKLIGKDPENLTFLHEIIEKAVVGNTAAKAVTDIALYDLVAKARGVPVYKLLGGLRSSRLSTEENIPFFPLEETITRARAIIQSGCKFIKIRVGLKPFSKDVNRVKAICETARESGADDVEFAIDANQAWSVKEAVHNIHLLSQYGVRIVEQPVKAKDLLGMKYIRDHTDVKLLADEGVFTPEDLELAAALGAVDGVHIKLIKSGGITNALKMVHIAEAANLIYMIGGMDEGMMAVAAAVQLAAAVQASYHELDGHIRIANDVCIGLEVHHSIVYVPESAGLGVSIDESQLDIKYRIRQEEKPW